VSKSLNDPQAPAPVPASTILLLRDGAKGLEVFMVVRHHQIDFASGALVFPGGKVDQADRDPALRALARLDPAWDETEIAFRISGVREAFEEVGVLVARDTSTGAPIAPARAAELGAKFREALVKHGATMTALCQQENLELATDLLVPYAHWITPAIRAKRFDTRFYLVPVPEGQKGAHDGTESVDSGWFAPRETVAAADAGAKTMVFATRMNLSKLGRASTMEEALARARAARVVTVCPDLTERDGKRFIRIPPEADYDVTEMDITQLRTP